MLTLITKASSDYWYTFKDINTLDDLIRLYPRVVVSENYHDSEIFYNWKGFKKEDISKALSAKYRVMIYDDYIE